ncbi:MAG: fibrobacter succinogenes major paralogous domain-containing protein [Odoribacter sp.]|nr:fibrobacter succinogenes major paralogous domain-containing protein [Odoribacter sp.]
MKYTILVLALASVLLHACKNEEEKLLPVVKPAAEGTWTDSRDGSVYHWVRYGDLEWMSENMRIRPLAGSSATFKGDEEISEEELQIYGYLYDFIAANSLAIEEWRLPSEEDWQALERALGMMAEETMQTGWRGDFIGTLMMQDATGSGLNMKCGGYAHNLGGFGTRAFGVDGIYWSSTPDETTDGYAWCRMLTFNKDQVRRESMTTKRYMSVRLVRNVK